MSDSKNTPRLELENFKKSLYYPYIFYAIKKTLFSETFLHLLSLFPADPQVAPGEETGNGVSGQMVNPSFLSQLSHDGINEGEAGPSLKKFGERDAFIPGNK